MSIERLSLVAFGTGLVALIVLLGLHFGSML